VILDAVSLEIRLLFALYIVAIVGFFYVSLFNRTCTWSISQAERSREFVTMMPIHILHKDYASMVIQYFTKGTKSGPRTSSGPPCRRNLPILSCICCLPRPDGNAVEDEHDEEEEADVHDAGFKNVGSDVSPVAI
jgi:hypothetical protein